MLMIEQQPEARSIGRGAERPYFQISMTQLETMFDQRRSDAETLGALDHELEFPDNRTRSKASCEGCR
jgi:hypothetical protein